MTIEVFLLAQQTQGWKVRMIDESRNDEGGYKTAVMEIQGDKVYSKMKFEVSVWKRGGGGGGGSLKGPAMMAHSLHGYCCCCCSRL